MGLIGLAAMSGSFGVSGPYTPDRQSKSGGIPENPKRIIPNGAQLFTIRGIEVVAISRKRAEDKVRKSHPGLFMPGVRNM